MTDDGDERMSELERALQRLEPSPAQAARWQIFEALVFAENKAKLEKIVADLVVHLGGVTPKVGRVEEALAGLLDQLEDEHLVGPNAFGWWPRGGKAPRSLPRPDQH